MTIIISEDDFDAVWGAYARSDGELFSHADIVHKPLNLVWTVVDDGEGTNTLYALPGFHIVNKVGYVLTTKAWDDPQQEAYWFKVEP